MKKTTEPNVEIGTSAAPEMFYIKILADGPYLVYGNPPIDQEIIMPNEDGASWVYKKGRHYKTEGEYTALCRCGESCKKPFCDGSHSKADWNPEETSDKRPLLEDAELLVIVQLDAWLYGIKKQKKFLNRRLILQLGL